MLPQSSDKDGLHKELLSGDRKDLSHKFSLWLPASLCQMRYPTLSAANKFTPSLASTASYVPSKRKSEATLSSPGRTELFWIWVVGYLIFFFFSFSFCLSLISPWFINNCSAVKKQSINCSQRKVKLSKEPLSFAVYLFFPLEPVLADEMRQAGGQAAPLPCPPLPLDGGWPGGSGAALIYVSWEPGPVHPSPWQHCRLAPHLVVF